MLTNAASGVICESVDAILFRFSKQTSTNTIKLYFESIVTTKAALRILTYLLLCIQLINLEMSKKHIAVGINI